MRKLVIKTIAITLTSIVGALVVAFGATWLFAPKILANVFDGVGSYAASVFFYEEQFNKTGDISDLAVLVDKLDIEKDAEKAEGLLKKLVTHDNFEEFAIESDAGKTPIVSTKEYYAGLYTVVLYDNGKLLDSLQCCALFVMDSGYTASNPYRTLIAERFNEFSDYDIEKINLMLEEELPTLSGDEYARAVSDLDILNSK